MCTPGTNDQDSWKPQWAPQKDSFGCRFWAMYAIYVDLEAAYCRELQAQNNNLHITGTTNQVFDQQQELSWVLRCESDESEMTGFFRS